MEFIIEIIFSVLWYLPIELGAFICWMFTGFRGSYREMRDRHAKKFAFVGLAFIVGVIALVIFKS